MSGRAIAAAALPSVWTIGHSTRPSEELVDVLVAQSIEAVADVRRWPASRKHPQFNEDALRRSLADSGVEYLSLPDMGGRRSPRSDSPHDAWRVAAFRGYADYMDTEPFRLALAMLLQLAERKRTAILCAEILWWRCHRSLIADLLKSRGHRVFHIRDRSTPEEHPYTSAARIVGGRLSYAKG